MSRRVYSPWRLVAVVVLSVVTVWCFGVWSSNATPHGRDEIRQEQPIEPHRSLVTAGSARRAHARATGVRCTVQPRTTKPKEQR